MKSLSFGEIPPDLEIPVGGYEIRPSAGDLMVLAEAINQGIDSHLEAVFFERTGDMITIRDADSMRALLRRLTESGSEDAESLASAIMETLDYEWI